MRNVAENRSTKGGGVADLDAPSGLLRLLCLCLADGTPGETAPLHGQLAGADWVALAALANAFLVAPALWAALAGKGLWTEAPSDFRAYLGAIYDANAIRMTALRDQARRAIVMLNGSDIVPIVLKGGARLFEGEAEPQSAQTRMMADLDLLVEEPRFVDALAILRGLGYVVSDEPNDGPSHAATLRRPGEVGTIDLHRDIGPQRKFIAMGEAAAEAATVADSHCRLRLLSPTHRVMHGFFHAQIHDRGHAAGIIPLRHLLDFAWIANGHSSAIDWSRIVRTCERLELRAEWDAWLLLAHRCLGLAPMTPPRQPWRAELHYRRCLFQLDHSNASSMLRFGLAITEPLSYANISYRYERVGSLTGARLREVVRLAGKYRHRLPQRLLAALRDAR